jgi:hypothetical protein
MLCNGDMIVHHIGYAVRDIEKARKIFSLLGYKEIGGGGGVLLMIWREILQ